MRRVSYKEGQIFSFGALRISQDVDPYRTCKLVIPKPYLPRLPGMAVTGPSRRRPRKARRRS